jgi:predicted metal-dependent hydrolase
MNTVEFILILLAIYLLSSYVREQFTEVAYVESSVDKRRYLVRNAKDKQQAADLLAKLNQRMEKLIHHVHDTYIDGKDKRLRAAVKRLKSNYNPDSISEGTDKSNYTSYSVNKGEKIVFCIRSRDEKEALIDINTIMYVAVHELAHLMTKEVGHTPLFWDNFKLLLEHAVDLNLYKKVDYSKKPVPYCGITISSSILH